MYGRVVLRWRETGWGDHFLPQKFFKRSFEERRPKKKNDLNAEQILQNNFCIILYKMTFCRRKSVCVCVCVCICVYIYMYIPISQIC